MKHLIHTQPTPPILIEGVDITKLSPRVVAGRNGSADGVVALAKSLRRNEK